MQDDASRRAFYEAVGGKVHACRRDAGFTQDQVAKQLGLSRPAIVGIERGRQALALHQLVQLAEIFKVELTTLVPPADQRSAPGRLKADQQQWVDLFVSHVNR